MTNTPPKTYLNPSLCPHTGNSVCAWCQDGDAGVDASEDRGARDTRDDRVVWTYQRP